MNPDVFLSLFSLSEIFEDRSALEELLKLYQALEANTVHKMESLLKKICCC